MLDGTTHSLHSALNTLEIFGSFSGLKMNKDKTRVVWIGRKRYSREKLFISGKLDRNNSDFTLLGLQFSTNLNLIPEMNYSKAIESTKAFLGKWENSA